MSKLSIKTLTRKNLPYGKFKFQVLLARQAHNVLRADTNAAAIEEVRKFLEGSCRGKWKLIFTDKSRGKRVYTHLYLTDPMDLAMLKLTHQDLLFKIYKIILEQPSE